MCSRCTRGLYSVVITRQSNPPISQFNSPSNEYTSVRGQCVQAISRRNPPTEPTQTSGVLL